MSLQKKPLTIDVVNSIASDNPAVFEHGIQNGVVRHPTATRRVKWNRIIRSDDRLVFPFVGGVFVNGATTGPKQSAGREYKCNGSFHSFV